MRLTPADRESWRQYQAANRRAADAYYRGDFTTPEIRAAHARHSRGIDDPATREGERQYHRDRQCAAAARTTHRRRQ